MSTGSGRGGSRNQVYGEPYRGFESLPLRHFFIISFTALRLFHHVQATYSSILRRGEVCYPPSQKATGSNPRMNARGGTLRNLGEGGYASEGSARRSLWRGATAVRRWGSTLAYTAQRDRPRSGKQK